MEIEGRIWKEENVWLVEIPSLDAMTQGKSRKNALLMTHNLIEEMMTSYFGKEATKKIKVFITDAKDNIVITSNDTKLLLALSLRRQREQSGTTIKEASLRLGSKSPNAYAQYEKGATNITIEKFEHLLNAVNPKGHRRLRLI